MTLADFLPTPETAAAWTAVCELAAQVGSEQELTSTILFLHGPPGTGKSHLAQGLLASVHDSNHTAELTGAADLARLPEESFGDKRIDLWIIEDVQSLAKRAAGTLDRILEIRMRNRKATVLTASTGPGRLELPPRLTNRLSSGLVLGLEIPSVASRRSLLQHMMPPGLRVQPKALDWLAQRVTSVRALSGAMQTVIELAKQSPTPLDRTSVQQHWDREPIAALPTPESILETVANYFKIDAEVLRAKGRAPGRAWPTQIAMALARKYTTFSVAELAKFFDNREPRTIRYAVTFVEEKIAKDPVAAADWRQLISGLGVSIG